MTHDEAIAAVQEACPGVSARKAGACVFVAYGSAGAYITLESLECDDVAGLVSSMLHGRRS